MTKEVQAIAIVKEVKKVSPKGKKAGKVAIVSLMGKMVTDTAGIAKNIKAIQTKGKAFEKLVHTTAVSILDHVSKHGNINQAREMVVALPSMSRKNALIEWFVAYGCFKYNEETKLLDFERKETKLDLAIKTPFWSFKVEEDFQPMSYDQLIAAITRLVKQAEKKQTDNKVVKLADFLKEQVAA